MNNDDIGNQNESLDNIFNSPKSFDVENPFFILNGFSNEGSFDYNVDPLNEIKKSNISNQPTSCNTNTNYDIDQYPCGKIKEILSKKGNFKSLEKFKKSKYIEYLEWKLFNKKRERNNSKENYFFSQDKKGEEKRKRGR